MADEQVAHPVDATRWGRLAEQVLLAEGVSGAAELALLFVDEEVMADLNRRFMRVDGPTDVLSFPLDGDLVAAVVDGHEGGRWPDAAGPGPDREPPELGELPLLLGDVVVCPAVAARNAPAHAGSVDDELALLVVHGVLHVLGHDHAEPDERAEMQGRERAHLEAFHGIPALDPWQPDAEASEGEQADARRGEDA
ncbi:MAG: rRNA maturation RNase YbeY [Acidimicrobiales bacterium]|nr:rRNA maturation RNase YbeY [Acidimicrobiales bacterium]